MSGTETVTIDGVTADIGGAIDLEVIDDPDRFRNQQAKVNPPVILPVAIIKEVEVDTEQQKGRYFRFIFDAFEGSFSSLLQSRTEWLMIAGWSRLPRTLRSQISP